MEISALASYGTIVSLSAASLLLVYQLIRQRRGLHRRIWTFSFLILFLVLDWLIVELFETVTRRASLTLGLVHFLTMLIFAIGITLSWSRSTHRRKTPTEPELVHIEQF